MIGVFDSGIGGLTVVRALRAKRPDLPLIYLGDTARTPYGTKGGETVRRYASEAADFLLGKGASAIIIACNTASALASGYLREKHPQVPVFDVVTPSVEAALAATKNRRVGVIGTRATIASGVYESRLSTAKRQAPAARCQVFSNPAPLLVSLAEEGWIEAPETGSIVGKYVAPLREAGVDTLILGCTHYPLLKRLIAERMGPGVRLIDSAEAAADSFCATLERDKALAAAAKKGKGVRYCATDPNATFAGVASAWLGEPIAVERAVLPA